MSAEAPKILANLPFGISGQVAYLQEYSFGYTLAIEKMPANRVVGKDIEFASLANPRITKLSIIPLRVGDLALKLTQGGQTSTVERLVNPNDPKQPEITTPDFLKAVTEAVVLPYSDRNRAHVAMPIAHPDDPSHYLIGVIPPGMDADGKIQFEVLARQTLAKIIEEDQRERDGLGYLTAITQSLLGLYLLFPNKVISDLRNQAHMASIKRVAGIMQTTAEKNDGVKRYNSRRNRSEKTETPLPPTAPSLNELLVALDPKEQLTVDTSCPIRFTSYEGQDVSIYILDADGQPREPKPLAVTRNPKGLLKPSNALVTLKADLSPDEMYVVQLPSTRNSSTESLNVSARRTNVEFIGVGSNIIADCPNCRVVYRDQPQPGLDRDARGRVIKTNQKAGPKIEILADSVTLDSFDRVTLKKPQHVLATEGNALEILGTTNTHITTKNVQQVKFDECNEVKAEKCTVIGNKTLYLTVTNCTVNVVTVDRWLNAENSDGDVYVLADGRDRSNIQVHSKKTN